METVSATRSALEAIHDPYFVQRVRVSRRFAGVPRGAFFTQLLAGKSVLHVGYADWPITDLSENLHVILDPVCARLDGVDPHDEAAEAMRPHVRGGLFTGLEQVTDSYDFLLIPEVIEHVGDIESFFAAIDQIDFSTVVITAPDAFSCRARHFDLVGEGNDQTLVEVVHPDHNYWYTPYTLTNVVRKYTSWTVLEPVYFFNGISLLLFANKRHDLLGSTRAEEVAGT